MFAGADVRIGNYGLQRNGGLIRGVLWPGTHDHFSSITGAVDPVIIPFVGANAVRHRAQRQGNATRSFRAQFVLLGLAQTLGRIEFLHILDDFGGHI